MSQPLMLKDFREQLNLSQTEMARFLRTSRSQVAMVERGTRSLANDAGMRLLSLYHCSSQTGTLSVEATVQVAEGTDLLKEELNQKWGDKLARNKYEKNKLEYQLKNMAREWESTLVMLQTMEQMIALTSEMPGTDGYRLYAMSQQYSTQKKLIACGEAAQHALKVKIELLNAEIRILEKNLFSGK